ncbi:hypothetical protein [Pedobacter frigidisoli]|uniref:Crp/Fnr family transcriptional regulator n=1 Tax=Pedobacter frigidisoli TaxID=2530455 RepID=UPI00292F614B|nr:hypothetical protein [Pedobacter frigidisoli]
MEMEYLQQLKVHLQSLGALRPEAWEKIIGSISVSKLKKDENLVRENGTIAYVVSGALKEFDSWRRSHPTIVNFITADQFIVTGKRNQSNYIVAYNNCIVYEINRTQLNELNKLYPELQQIHDGICESYDQAIAFRSMLMDNYAAEGRVEQFKQHFKSILNLMSKGDMANYLGIEYGYLLTLYN